ncbi:hypothetical protein KCV87_00490 [Actinosynnema pretiosum subsp. pretiosum]|uniref:Peptidase inhibitor family I36 n=2 Tax=Actinosynnema TaxID=40566 RepID=C6WEJ2_ACTMD|nr:hypothetical protein [Actinosynnema mirum]ACU37792.1 hypothetical protein Amir_3921 [Actinosynnema mirum DSM 43827]AXX31276.1 hypothetical protein APASM_3911 [Actinosynnema pretiosum subsp. pretiosum]QUF04662.1 hypothetical protein KCV87_00490 [Actinosynnema pretiosum subsp. pretiosum]
MRSRFRVLSALLAVSASLAVFSPAASADPIPAPLPPNCDVADFCTWSVFVIPGEPSDAVPTIRTTGDWSGEAVAFRLYNNTGRYAHVSYEEKLDDGTIRRYESCFGPVWRYFTRPFTVTGVTFHDRPTQQYC